MRVEPGHSCSDEEFLFRIPDRIPIFPLPNVVLFPKTYLPLHIFEPRYREMVRDAAAGRQCIGMALLKEGWEANYYGAPPLYPIGCVGRLVRMQPLPDGRFDILLLGLERCLIEESFNDRSYREARIALRPDVPGEALPASLRAEVERLLTESPQLQQQQHGWQEVLRAEVAEEIQAKFIVEGAPGHCEGHNVNAAVLIGTALAAKDRYTVIVEDVIVSVPAPARAEVLPWLQERTTAAWQRHGRISRSRLAQWALRWAGR